jgi:hypothetical protein
VHDKQVSVSGKNLKMRPRSEEDYSAEAVAQSVASAARAVRQRMDHPEVQEAAATGLALFAAGASALAGWMSKK